MGLIPWQKWDDVERKIPSPLSLGFTVGFTSLPFHHLEKQQKANKILLVLVDTMMSDFLNLLISNTF